MSALSLIVHFYTDQLYMKKLFIFLITISFVYQSEAQNFLDLDFKKSEPQTDFSIIENYIQEDSSTSAGYLSYQQFYNKKGKAFLELKFSPEGDTLSRIEFFYPSETKEVKLFYEGNFVDSSIEVYTQTGYLIKEQWHWEESKEKSSTLISYNKDNQPIKIQNFYDFGAPYDSLIYEKKKLVEVQQFFENLPEEVPVITTYTYNKKGYIVEALVKNTDGKTKQKTSYTYKDGLSKPIKKVQETFDYYNINQSSSWISDYTYHKNDEIASIISKFYKNDSLNKTIKHYLNKKGYNYKSEFSYEDKDASVITTRKFIK